MVDAPGDAKLVRQVEEERRADSAERVVRQREEEERPADSAERVVRQREEEERRAGSGEQLVWESQKSVAGAGADPTGGGIEIGGNVGGGQQHIRRELQRTVSAESEADAAGGRSSAAPTRPISREPFRFPKMPKSAERLGFRAPVEKRTRTESSRNRELATDSLTTASCSRREQGGLRSPAAASDHTVFSSHGRRNTQ